MAHYDLKQYAEAKVAFEKYLRLTPSGKHAAHIRQLLDSL